LLFAWQEDVKGYVTDDLGGGVVGAISKFGKYELANSSHLLAITGRRVKLPTMNTKIDMPWQIVSTIYLEIRQMLF
jgi:hypothetical protein